MLFIFTSIPAYSMICKNMDYWISSEEDYNYKVSIGRDVVLKRFIVVPSFDKNYKGILTSQNDSEVLARFAFMLKKNKSKLVEEYINKCDTRLEINSLIKGLYYFSQNQYQMAISNLEHYKSIQYGFLKLLLIADCKYELLANKNDYINILSAYQTAFDFTDLQFEKTIVSNRMKYIKYR